jgi:DNA helicase IV
VDDHPELQAEQAYLTRAYDRLEQLRRLARERLRSVLGQGTGTPQYLEERDVIVRTSLARLEQLDIGDQALCFGRIDRLVDDRAFGSGQPNGARPSQTAGAGEIESFHIGRLGVSGEDLEPLVVDWRAPVAEPFYRATGRDPMGLVLRRHIAADGPKVTDIEDERFVPAGTSTGDDIPEQYGGGYGAEGAVRGAGPGRGDTDHRGADHSGADHVDADHSDTDHSGPGISDDLEVGGPGALLAALEGARTGRMRDIVATIQGEQDAIIRSELPGVLVVQGGPGTGKTAVALHRAAYLLYTHRFPLERQGVLVIGPNPLFLRYIEKVLPSLGESGVTLSTISGLVHGFQIRGDDAPEVARLKGDARMARVVTRAVRTRQRPLVNRTVEIPFGSAVLHLTTEVTSQVVASARRRPGTHNARRRFVEQLVIRRLADEYQKTREGLGETRRIVETARDSIAQWGAAAAEDSGELGADDLDSGGVNSGGINSGDLEAGLPGSGAELDIADFGRRIRRVPAFVEALDRIWPRLSAEELLHDLFGAPPLLAIAAKGILTPAEQRLLHRRRSPTLSEVPFTVADAALVDEARVVLGPRYSKRPGASDSSGSPAPQNGSEDDAPRTYGHIVVDEAQDLSPMQLRMVGRRSLSGSVTVVGDIGQATGPWAADSWDSVTAHLPRLRPAREVELSVSYRTPAEVMQVASRVLEAAAPSLKPPTAVRHTGVAPVFVETRPEDLAAEVAAKAAELSAELAPGTVAVLSPASLVAELALALDAAGVRARDPRRDGLGAPVSLLPVDMANGLEFDAAIVVEPAAVVDESVQGLRRLYVALTRPTRRLAVLHARPLPASLSSRETVSVRD